MADVVGLRFVTTGEKEAIAAYERYKAGLLSLGQVQNKHVAAFNRRAREELRAINDVARAAAQAARVRQQAAQSYNQLAGSMDPAVAASNRLQAAQRTLQTAFDQGVISAQKKAAMLRQLNAQYKADELNRYAAAQRSVSDAIIQGDAVVKRLSGDMQTLTERLRQGTITQQQHDTALKALARQLAINNNYIKTNGQLNIQRAMAELRATEATRAAAAADAAAAATKARLTQSYNQLLASINPVIARQQQTRQTVDMLRAAVAAGAITTTQAAQALLQYRNALRQADAANVLATRGMSRVGVVTQQAGYQVGDFIVQIQSGTNVMVALGQQATQLIGTFAMLARTTRGIAIFSALGVVVPILTAIGAAYMRASGSSETLSQKLQKLDEASDKLHTTLQRLDDTELDQTFGDLTDEVLSITQAMRGLDEAAQLNNLMGVLDRVESAASAGWFRMMDAQVAQGVENLRAFFNPFESMVGAAEVSDRENEKAFAKLGFGMARAQFLAYTENLRTLAQSGDVAGVTQEFDRFLQDATDNGAVLSMTGIALAASMEQTALATAKTAAELNGSAEAARMATAAEERRLEAVALYNDNLSAAEEERARVDAERAAIRSRESEFLAGLEAENELARRKLEILQSYNAAGEETAQTQELQLALDMDILRGKLLQQAAVDGITQAERDAIDEQVRLAEEVARTEAGLNNAAGAGKDLADALHDAAAAMTSLLNVGSLEAKLAGLVAETRAITAGADAASASFVASELAKAAAMRDAALAEGAIPSRIVNQAYEDRVGIVNQIGEATTARNAARDAARPGRSGGGGGGGGGAAREQEDYLKNLLLEAEHKRRLVGLTEEQTRRQEILFDLEKRKLPIDEERIEQIIRVEAETRALMALEEQRMQLMQTVEGHIENAFMSFVQGSATVEEAFKGMLRNIILAIYQQQVAEPAARAVGGLLGKVIPALFSANGNVFSGGAHVTAYANGGVVNSPTMFQHSGGLGVMGEAGPEAIMPLKRGANGKLGVQMEGAPGGNVTVQQYFQISANGDESVRRIVRQEAPRMAEMAKSAVVDAKRRGGAYGRSF